MQLAPDQQSPRASIESISWLPGAWIGEGLGGYCDEVWSIPKAGSMFGTFRLIQDDKLLFSEFMEITESDGTILLRLKHFGSDFIGWETKDKHVTFQLVKITEDAAYFEGLTYKRTGENAMEVYVVIDGEHGSSEERFSYQRAD
jgi:hypothetical protein